VHIATLLAVTTLLHGISFSETRYHLPLVPLVAALAVRGVAGTPGMTQGRWTAAALGSAALASSWLRYLPELAGRYGRLAADDGWNSMLPF
jgi:hypothetical protein